jgi:hypothetical protein
MPDGLEEDCGRFKRAVTRDSDAAEKFWIREVGFRNRILKIWK